MSFTRTNLTQILIVFILLIGIGIRIKVYGDPRLSIATNDTHSYVESSQVPLFSKEIMTGRRLLSTNLVYKLLEPKDGYHILVNGSMETHRRQIQPGFDRIVVLQLALSIIGWSLLAFTISEHLVNPYIKILGVITIIFFAFTPQIADWDSILMSESLTFSLFAIQLAILIKLSFKICKDPYTNTSIYFIVWAVIFFFWSFLRDTNLFTSVITAGMAAIALLINQFKKNRTLRSIFLFAATVFIIGLITSSKSTRSLVQITNIYNSDLLPSSGRISILKGFGMPEPNSENYEPWFKENSSKVLIKFMVMHPGYPFFKIMKDFPMAFTETNQTYFKAPEQYQIRAILLEVGHALHPENTTPFLASLLLLFGLIILTTQGNTESISPWVWIGFWLFLTASFTLIPTILGDAWALSRHALFSTMIYRLFMWMFSIIMIDIAVEKKSAQVIPPTLSQIQ